MIQFAGHVDQLPGVEVVDDLVCHILRVWGPRLHDGQQQLARVVLQLPDKIHSGAELVGGVGVGAVLVGAVLVGAVLVGAVLVGAVLVGPVVLVQYYRGGESSLSG